MKTKGAKSVSLTSRERVERIIHFEKPDRVAFNFWMDRRRMAELDARHGPDFRVRHYDADIVESIIPIPYPQGRMAQRKGTSWLAEPLFASFEDARAIALPDPADPALYESLAYDLRRFADRAVIADLPNVLTYVEGMRSQEMLYLDMLLEPEAVKAFFGRLSDVMAGAADQVCRTDIAALYVMDDIAFNRGLLMSPAQFREFVLPHWKKVIDAAHAHHKPVFFHTDGNAEPIWDVFAEELGVRMLNPLQPNLQDISAFKRTYHGRMGVYGGIDTARLHLMSLTQIKEHVEDLFMKAGGDGGLIVSTHDLDYSISDEQLDAFVEAIKACVY